MPSLKEVNCKILAFDPTADDFVEKLEAASDLFKVKLPDSINKKKLFTYIVLAYDPVSELRKTIEVLPHRKMMCALTAGFVLNQRTNKFQEDIEVALSGGNMDVNRMIAEFCLLVSGLDFAAYAAYERIFVDVVALSHDKNKTKDFVPLIAKVRAEIESLEQKILGGDDVQLMRRALYLTSKKIGLNIRMEDIVERLEKGDDLSDFNEYSENYKPQELKYAGETIPEGD